MIMERFMQYTIPKMQAVSIDLDAENTVKTIEDKLREHMADYEESK